MTSRIRPFLVAAACFAAAVCFQPFAHAQGFGGMFSSFNLNGVSGDEMEASTVITANSADIDLENNVIALIGNVVVDDKSSRITCNRMEIYLDEDAADSLVGTAEKPEEEPGSAAPDRDQEKEADAAENADKPVEKNEDAENEAAENKDAENEEGDAEEEEEERKNIKRIDCIGDVVFRKRANPDSKKESDEDQIAMADRANYDVIKDVIVMTGAHSAPEKVVPAELFETMVRQIRSNNIARCPVMMQGDNWMVGESFTILLKEDNRLKVKEMRFNYIGDTLLPGDEKDEEKADGKTDGKDDESAVASADGKKDDSEKASADRKYTALISANDADIYLEHNIITLTGNVDVDQEAEQPVRMTCNKMEIILVDDVPEKDDGKNAADSGKKASKIHCTGEFVYRKRAGQDSNGEKDQIAMADRADYDAEKEILVLSGKPVMLQGPNKVHGSRIEIYPEEDNRMFIDTMKAYYTGKALLSSGDLGTEGATTLISAARADIRPDEIITLSRNVVVDDGTARIDCGKMEITMRKDSDSSSSLFGFNKPADDADGKDENELGNDISRIVCSDDVVYRKRSETGGQDQMVLSRTADYDADTETIIMSGSHSNPKSFISEKSFDEITRVIGKGKTGDAGASSGGIFKQYSVLMQGENWIAGNPITIIPQDGNRMKVNDMRATLRRSSRSKSAQEEP